MFSLIYKSENQDGHHCRTKFDSMGKMFSNHSSLKRTTKSFMKACKLCRNILWMILKLWKKSLNSDGQQFHHYQQFLSCFVFVNLKSKVARASGQNWGSKFNMGCNGQTFYKFLSQGLHILYVNVLRQDAMSSAFIRMTSLYRCDLDFWCQGQNKLICIPCMLSRPKLCLVCISLFLLVGTYLSVHEVSKYLKSNFGKYPGRLSDHLFLWKST